MTAIPLQRDVYYPESDGQPMAESDLHRSEMTYLIDALAEHFRQVPDVYVAGNLFLYYVKGKAGIRVAPDVFVVKGVSKAYRKSYKLWEEGHAPFLIIEVTSDNTKDEDLYRKKHLYERLGVQEYILHDPLGDYLSPQLQGYQLASGRYQPMEPQADGSLISQTTRLILRPAANFLRLIDAATGKPLLRYDELAAELERLRNQPW